MPIPALIAGATAAAKAGVGAGIGKALFGSVLGGITGGIAKRLEGQIAGRPGQFATGVGYQTEATLSGQRELQQGAHTQQNQSQGQQHAFLLGLEEMRQNADWIRQANQISAMERMQIRQLAFDAEMMNGQQSGFAPAGLAPEAQRDYIRNSTQQRLRNNIAGWRTFHDTISGPPTR